MIYRVIGRDDTESPSISIQVKAHEVHILPFEERKSILDFKENEDDEEVESEKEDDYEDNDELLE